MQRARVPQVRHSSRGCRYWKYSLSLEIDQSHHFHSAIWETSPSFFFASLLFQGDKKQKQKKKPEVELHMIRQQLHLLKIHYTVSFSKFSLDKSRFLPFIMAVVIIIVRPATLAHTSSLSPIIWTRVMSIYILFCKKFISPYSSC